MKEIDKLDFIKIKNLCSEKVTVKKMKDKPRLRESICKTYLLKDWDQNKPRIFKTQQ